MQRYTIVIIFLVMLLSFMNGCAPKDEGDIPNFGQDTLSSEGKISGSTVEVQGFDFSEGRNRYEFPVPGSSSLDMAIEPVVSGTEAIGIIMSSPSQLPLFYEMGNTFLENIDEAPADGYIPQVFITIGYSYCIVTAEGNFAKIYIVDWEYGQRESGAFFAWIRFDWVYQDDGSRTFGDTGSG